MWSDPVNPRRRGSTSSCTEPAESRSSAGLNPDAAAVEWDERGVRVSFDLQSTSNAAVYAAGDAANTPGMPLTPVAVFEGKVAAPNMLKASTTVPD